MAKRGGRSGRTSGFQPPSRTLLGQTFGFELYVSDREMSYCICFNHHDMLLGLGRAEAWLTDVSTR